MSTPWSEPSRSPTCEAKSARTVDSKNCKNNSATLHDKRRPTTSAARTASKKSPITDSFMLTDTVEKNTHFT